MPLSRSLLPLLLLGAPVLTWSSAPTAAYAQAALFAEPLIEILPGPEVVGDGATAVNLSILALDETGAPISGLTGKITPTDGSVQDLREIRPGLYQAAWTPPQVSSARQVSFNFKGKAPGKDNLQRRWDIGVTPPLAQRITVTASQDRVVLGQDGSVSMTFTLAGGGDQPLRGTDLVVRSSAGTVANITHLGGGQFSALFTPPNKPYPHVALITVSDKRDPSAIYGTLALPLVGKASFPVTAAPGSRVMIRVGDKDYGPVQADTSGRANVPIIVPPGYSQGTLITVVGETKSEQPLDLQLPPTQRVSLFPVHTSVPADPSLQVPVRVLVVRPDGSPDPAADVTFSATAGQVSAARHEGNGVYAATFTPPYGNAASQATLQVAVADAKGPQNDSLTIDLIPARPASIAATAEPATLPSGGTGFTIYSKITGPDGAGMPGRQPRFIVNGAAEDGAVRDLGSGDYQMRFTTTGDGPAELIATLDGAASANPLRHVLVLPSRERLDNDGLSSAMLTILTVDRFGYPVPNVPVSLKRMTGDGSLPTEVTTDRNGFAQVYYTAGRVPGLVRIQASALDHTSSANILQVPAAAAAGLTALPASASTAGQALLESWRKAAPSVWVPREGGSQVLTAGAQTIRAAGPLARFSVVAEPASVAPGGSVTLRIRAEDSAGMGKSGVPLEFLASAGSVGAVTDLGGGDYVVPLVLPADAVGDVRFTVASGDVSKYIKIPVAAPAAVSAWGVGADPAAVTPAVPSTPAPEPVAVSPTPDPIAPSPDSKALRPWLRVQGGYLGGFYRYDQQPAATNGPLYQKAITFGGGTTSPAASAGVSLMGRAFIPTFEWIGFESSYTTGRYAVALPEFEDPVPDWNNDFSALVITRYPFAISSSAFHVGGRLGLGVDDFILYRQTVEGDQRILSYEPVITGAMQLGAEVGAEFTDRWFSVLSLDAGLAGATSHYRTEANVSLGYAFLDNFYAHAGLNMLSRHVIIEDEDAQKVGEIQDGSFGFILGIGAMAF